MKIQLVHFLHKLRITVRPTSITTFDFCFEGIEKGSIVAVSTYMASAHGNRQDQKEWFITGYNEMLRRIEPEKIICYYTPFPEMQGDIIYVDYDRSSWRYLNDKRSFRQEDLSTFQIDGYSTVPYNTISAFMDVPVIKGGGSAYGGQWRPSPNKPGDQRFLGNPGQIISSHAPGKHGGYERDTKIGDDGRATVERHYTDHDRPDLHTDPHDHIIDWSRGFPNPGPPINYPDGAPEFKRFGGHRYMKTTGTNSFEANRFKTISDFKWCVNYGGEVEFEWKGLSYGIWPKLRKTPDAPLQMLISQIYIDNPASTEKWCDTADELLEYMVGGDRLRDVITQVTVWDRTI